MNNGEDAVIVLGGGLAGLSAGYVLAKAGVRVKIFESDSMVGGLSKTLIHNGFRFDLGGHRFFTTDENVNAFVKNLMGSELISVCRKSKIYMRNQYIDYPLRPFNAVFSLGLPVTLKIIGDYGIEKVKSLVRKKEDISLEDWVVRHFGRTMFNMYFKEYSEKVWGMECGGISAEWVEQRIRGLSLAKAIRNAFFRFAGKDMPTLVDSFLYPRLGIGRISDRLKEEIVKNNDVYISTSVERVNHSDFTVDSIVAGSNTHKEVIPGKEFISSIPLPKLVGILNPAPPENILAAASRLKFRDLIVVAIMIDRRRVTDQTWIYVPERNMPFGRIHEPTNWSEEMAPEGKTIMVMEFFSFRGDRIWNESDEGLVDLTVANLEQLGFIASNEVIDSAVVRVPKAYPLFEVGYRNICREIHQYLSRFKNLHITGRGGMFRYYNMDHAIESGVGSAERVLKKAARVGKIEWCPCNDVPVIREAVPITGDEGIALLRVQ
ncbi:MAG TPA: FAD-dependent oxidoreductase [Nitrospiraceae bacterium]|jgi:protoporphyrinogen oxidase|nr:FAD-dependent oxidoreductase [Nitrospiraceae bacterium]